jgi:hypothetical protein
MDVFMVTRDRLTRFIGEGGRLKLQEICSITGFQTPNGAIKISLVLRMDHHP